MVRFKDHDDLLSPKVRAELDDAFPSGEARMWGVTPGKEPRRSNVQKFQRLRPGDAVLFYGEGHFYLVGRIAVLWENAELAERLWQRDDKGQTWQYMYALDEVRPIQVPLAEVRPQLGWRPTAIVQGFNIFDGDIADFIGDLCNLRAYDTEVSETSAAGGSNRHTGDLETKSVGSRRGEQVALRKRLRELGADRCALCGRELPAEFLVAAHIKPRRHCTDDEKRDLDNVAMLACLLGCDSLYEHGYIGVGTDGEILVSDRAGDCPSVHDLIDRHLAQQRTAWWSPQRARYFDWHREHRFLAAPGPGLAL
ncbi:HNH endonuclease [Saccharopolyspora shandongensis]|uniref:HNH endonuclease n=1 Tax=Saccharopolyspora shandongensis TaxID=418495 RepID=UPI00341B571F